jgi:hypothetical protein
MNEQPNQDNNGFFVDGNGRRPQPIIQGDSDLIYAFAEPDSKEYHDEFKHIGRDVRMANTTELDFAYLNIAAPLTRAVDDLLGHNSKFSIMLKHDMAMADNMSVGRGGFGMKTLVTRKQQQEARIIQDSRGFLSKDDKGNGGV